MNKIQDPSLINHRVKKIHDIINHFAVFILTVSIVTSFTSPALNAAGQPNETGSFHEDNVNQTIAETPQGQKEQGIKQLISENTSPISIASKNSSNNPQNTTNELNQKGEASDTLQPDGDCLFDPALPKCTPDENGCPEGFGINEDDQCFPYHDRCPVGYHSHEDDESGKCIPDKVPCEPGFILNPNFPSCDNKDYVCQNNSDLDECKQDDG